MKKFIKPNFEFIFSVSLIVILGLPPLVLAQNQKSIEIKIINNDTTVNGRDIKKLSAQERKEALATIDGLPNTLTVWSNDNKSNNRIIIKKQTNTNSDTDDINIEKDLDALNNTPLTALKADSAHKNVRIRLKKLQGADSVQAFTYRFDNSLQPMDMKTFSFDMPARGPRFENSSRNTQVFNYSNTDNDGINTNISFRVTEPSKEKLKRIAGTDRAGLAINDLNLTPEFSTGKTNLSFNLPAKTIADVKFTDTEGNVLWVDKATSGGFSKKISLPLNGVYYLQVKQGVNVAVKKIIKE
jgi:hypothetical protein